MESICLETKLIEDEIKLEIGMKSAGIMRFEKNNNRFMSRNLSSETDWNKRIIREAIYPMAKAIEIYVDYYSAKAGKPAIALAYIKLLEPETAAFITLKTILNESVKEVNLEAIVDVIGQRIEDEVRFSDLESHAESYVEKIKERLKYAGSQSYQHGKAALLAGERALSEPKSEEFTPLKRWEVWGIDAQRHIGAALLTIAVENVYFNGSPLFEKVNFYVKQGVGSYKETTKLKIKDEIVDWIDQYKEIMRAESPAYRPTVIPPLDWSTPYNGGYHVDEIRSTMAMVKGRDSQVSRLTIQQMPQVYKCINNLQRIPWQISSEVLTVAKDIISIGSGLAMPQKQPYDKPACPVPEEFKEVRGKELKQYLTSTEWDDFIGWRREITEVYQKDNKRKSKYLNFFNTVSTADIYKDYKNIYFVYTADSRGRYYATSSTISPQGDDFQKGLIKFAKGMPLGKDGKYWLAVHGSGKWGNDKCTFDERVKFIDDMTEDIRDFVADPLTNTGWASADKPWQFLNWAFEWAKLHDWIDSGKNEENFISYIAPSQDGSCSGLQHYSAMLRDKIGGQAVNLTPSDKPQDIYARVANLTQTKLENLRDTGETPQIKETANGLLTIKGGVNRALTKPPVMTKTYGSTLIRCLKTTSEYFIELQSKEDKAAKAEKRKPIPVHPFIKNGDTGIKLRDAEKLMANTIWEALKETVTSTVEGMEFIQDIAWKMAKAGCHLEWQTPTGFIVEQKEYEYKSRRINTQLLGSTRFTIREETKKFDHLKMKTASAPNFVHSMDASHLTFVVNAMVDAGFEGIAVVHDDFATHACNTGKLRDILRETFVKMYEEHNIFEEFKEHNESLLLEEIDINTPAPGNLDLREVLKSAYAFG